MDDDDDDDKTIQKIISYSRSINVHINSLEPEGILIVLQVICDPKLCKLYSIL